MNFRRPSRLLVIIRAHQLAMMLSYRRKPFNYQNHDIDRIEYRLGTTSMHWMIKPVGRFEGIPYQLPVCRICDGIVKEKV